MSQITHACDASSQKNKNKSIKHSVFILSNHSTLIRSTSDFIEVAYIKIWLIHAVLLLFHWLGAPLILDIKVQKHI